MGVGLKYKYAVSLDDYVAMVSLYITGSTDYLFGGFVAP